MSNLLLLEPPKPPRKIEGGVYLDPAQALYEKMKTISKTYGPKIILVPELTRHNVKIVERIIDTLLRGKKDV